ERPSGATVVTAERPPTDPSQRSVRRCLHVGRERAGVKHPGIPRPRAGETARRHFAARGSFDGSGTNTPARRAAPAAGRPTSVTPSFTPPPTPRRLPPPRGGTRPAAPPTP